MNKRIIIIILSVLVPLFLVIQLVTKFNQTDCRYVIPRGSVIVGRLPISDIDPLLTFLGDAYLFEDKHGLFGVAARIPNGKVLKQHIKQWQEKGKASKVEKRRNTHFCVLNEHYLLSWRDGRLLIMGPVLASDQKETMVRMASYLKCEKKKAISDDSPLMKALNTMTGKRCVVARSDVMPERVTTPMLIGVPKNSDLADILITMEIEKTPGCLVVYAHTTSPRETIEKAINEAFSHYGVITDTYLGTVGENDDFSLLANIQGGELAEQLRGSESVRLLMAGLNTAIDFDKMAEGISGDIIVTGKDGQILMIAQSPKATWLKDVGYWKQSAPEGTRIDDWKPLAFRLVGKAGQAYFGATMRGELFIASSLSMAQRVDRPADDAAAGEILQTVKGQKMAAIINLSVLMKSQNAQKLTLPTVFNLNSAKIVLIRK